MGVKYIALILVFWSTHSVLAQTQRVQSFTLINADTDQDIAILQNDAVLDFSKLPTRNLNIRANTNPSVVGSVEFTYDENKKTESSAPYALLGDIEGDYVAWTPSPGKHTLSATAYSGANGSGAKGGTLTINFTVNEQNANNPPSVNAGPDKTFFLPTNATTLTGSATDSDGSIASYAWSKQSGPSATLSGANTATLSISNMVAGTYIFRLTATDDDKASAYDEVTVTVTQSTPTHTIASFTLVDATTNKDIGTLDDNEVIDLATLSSKEINILANTNPSAVGSVKFTLSGPQNTTVIESTLPYALFGDANGNYNPWTPSVGSYTLTGTVYSGSGGSGSAQGTLTVRFQVKNQAPPPGPAGISGELKEWHKITLTFSGPETSESANPNPFRDYRLNVTFTKGTKKYVVPGYFAADGNAGETGATAGNRWRVHFAPDEEGTWNYQTSFRSGSDIAASTDPNAGTAVSFDGQTGSFTVAATDKTGNDFRGKGRLNYVGKHYLQFAGNGEYFIKGGADSPENFLAYREFDNTYTHGGPNYTKLYAPHVNDWKNGDPTWKGGKGKGIIGAINYLSSKGMNSVYFLTNNVNGDGKDVWPWVSHTDLYRFDVSKLDQWEIVFSHMDKLGIMLHVITQEVENISLLDGGALGTQRKLYYRELIARFAHHLAINWNIGEENLNSDAERKAFANYFEQTDPYKHLVNIHTPPDQHDPIYTPLLGHPGYDGASLQTYTAGTVHSETLKWVKNSAAKGRKWVVTSDEIGPTPAGVVPDANDFWHNHVRKEALWGNLMAGGGGVEWYFGYDYAHSDLTGEDWRSRDNMWNLTRHALTFFQQHLPFVDMSSNDGLTSSNSDYCLALPGQVYAIYLPNGGTTNLNVGSTGAQYSVQWYNPRNGGALVNGSVTRITGSNNQSIGNPPTDASQDWVCLVVNTNSAYASATHSSARTASSLQQPEVQVSVFPNAFTAELTVQVKPVEQAPVTVRIVNTLGKPVASASSTATGFYTKTFNLSSLAPGIYTVEVTCGAETASHKVVKQ